MSKPKRARNNAEKQQEGTSKGSLFSEFARTLVVGAGTFLLGAVAIWLTPVKSCVTHKVWREAAEIMLLPDATRLTVGDRVGVTVLITPTSHLDVTEGVLTVATSREAQVTPEQLKTPSIAAPTPLSSPTFVVRALSVGLATVHVRLRTRYGEYTKQITLNIDARTASSQPTWGDFSGSWNIAVGPFLGEMQITQTGTRFDGKYFFGGGHEDGFVEGYRDGTEFHAAFIRKGASPFRWQIEAPLNETESLELKGTARLHAFEAGKLVAQTETTKFYGVPRD